jgi:hypothetical protein
MQGKFENKNHETAVSEVLGAVMLIAVVVTAIAVIGVALTSQSQPEKIPALDAIISSNGKDTIRIFHNGGDSLTSQQIAILVDGVDRTSSFTIQGSGWTTWSSGQSLDNNYGSLPGRVQLIYKSPSTQTVLVSADFAGGMPTYLPTVLPTPGAPATVTGITPAIGITGSSLPATISGSGFQTAATVSLVRGSAVIPAAGVMVVSQNQITCTFNLNGAATGSWNVNVTNPASPSGTLTNGFTIISQGPAPVVTRINPVSGNSGTSVSIGNLTGTGFVGGASVRLSRSGSSDLFAQNVNVLDANNLTCSFVLPGGTASGTWDVTVKNTDGQSGTLSNGFTVTNPGPAVTGATPATAYTGTSVTITNLAGSGFMNGATVSLNSTSDPTGIAASDVVVITQNQISCTFDLTGAPLGTRNIVVTNTDGKTGILVNGFTVAGNGPLVTAISPASGVAGSSYSPVSIGGSGFLNGATVKLNRTGSPDIIASGVNVASPNFISCAVSLPAGAVPGPWNVTVTNPDGQTGSLVGGFIVKNPAPTITGITPNTGARGWSVSITNLAGSNFMSGAVVKIVNTSAGPDISATNVVVVSATRITCTFDLTGVAAARRNVTVTNPYSDPGTLLNGFTVTSNQPVVTGSTPTTGAQAATISITNLAGTGFQPGAAVAYSQGAYSIPLTGVSVVSATRITGTLVIPSSAPTGGYSVTVTNTDGRAGTRASTFTVTSNAPTVTSRSNATMYRGWPGYELIGGINFVSGAQSVINTTTGTSIPSTSCVVRSATQMFCSYNLAGVPVSTAYRVAVINPDGKSGLMTTNLVSMSSPAPTIPNTPAFSPATGARGATVSVTAPGTYLQPGLVVVLTSANTPVTMITPSVNVLSPNQVILSFTIPPGATTGAYSARYTNPDGQTVTRTARFTVT